MESIGVEPTTFPIACGTPHPTELKLKIPNYCSGIPVESIGVEPTTSCMPCKRSSQLS